VVAGGGFGRHRVVVIPIKQKARVPEGTSGPGAGTAATAKKAVRRYFTGPKAVPAWDFRPVFLPARQTFAVQRSIPISDRPIGAFVTPRPDETRDLPDGTHHEPINPLTGNEETVAESATTDVDFTHDDPDLSPPSPAPLDPLAAAALNGPGREDAEHRP